MKSKTTLGIKLIALTLVFALLVPFIAACGGTKISYSGSSLADGQVGVEYTASVATATGADGITYALKDGDSLPAGLTLSSAGAISGVPTTAADAKSFTVVASTEGASAEASFSIKIKEADFAYEGGTVSTVVNQEANLSVATATGATGVTYTIKSGTLPEGLTFSNGLITGTPTTVSTVEIVVTATAGNLTPKDATWTVKVTLPRLEYSEVATENGMLGVYYTSLVNTATGSDNIKYSVAEGTTLPEGIQLTEDGLLYGIPAKRNNAEFGITASAEGFEPATATVKINVRAKLEAEGNGTISYTTHSMTAAMEDVLYVALSGEKSVATATADNYAVVSYKLAEGSTLPEGLTFYPNGAIYGTPTTRGTYKFTVVASADLCQDVSAEFSLRVKEPSVIYNKSIKLEKATVGVEYSADIATATTPNGAKVTYAVGVGTDLPLGLSLSADGKITGKPRQSARLVTFTVVASAEGYSDANCTVTMPVSDQETDIADGKMEIEYIDLTGISGAGYSGSAKEEAMVQNGANIGASNGYYLAYTHTANLTLTFKFKSSAAVTNAELHIGLGTELGNINLTTEHFGIYVNGVEVNFGSFALKSDNTTSVTSFTDYLAGKVSLNEGDNVIQLVVKENLLLKNQATGGPCIDYVQVNSSSTLRWTPCLYNTIGK